MTERNEHHTFKTDEIPCREISDPAVLSKTPLVSVPMITYNHEPFISKAIEGVINQKTEYSFELIIGEDCSTDGTMEIVLEYQKKYPDIIRVITSDKNVGACKNDMRTEKACRGKYVAYCEGDDYWHNLLKLQKQVDFLENHSDVGLVHSDADRFYWESNKKIKNAHRYYNRQHNDDSDLTVEFMKGNYPIYTCTVCVRSDLLMSVLNSDPYLFKSGRFPMGDQCHWRELARIGKFKYLDESLATYTIQPNSLSNSKDYKKKLAFLKAGLEMNFYFLKKYNLPEYVANFFLVRIIPSLCYLSYKCGDKTTAQEIKRDYSVFIKGRAKLFYLGAAYPVLYYLLNAIEFFLKFFSKR